MVKEKRDRALSFVDKAARAYDPDRAHSEQVSRLALALFDGLAALHGYGPAERRLLEIAGRLHDIGWSQAVSGKHHKMSFKMIRELPIPGLDERERFTCALVARYHNKALPDPSRHRGFRSLDAAGRRLVEWLGGMLRLADGLDCTHAGFVRDVACTVSGSAITIHLDSRGDCPMELAKAGQKKDLLAGTTGRQIEFN